MHNPGEFKFMPAGWREKYRTEMFEWQLQHSLRAEIAPIAAVVDALEVWADESINMSANRSTDKSTDESATESTAAVADDVSTQSLDTHFALVVLREIVLRQLRVDLCCSYKRAPGLS